MFPEHGTFELMHQQNIIIFDAQGAWNIEASERAIAEIRVIVDSFVGQPYAFIFDTNNVEGMTPDSFEAWSEAVAYWLDNGFKAIVRIDDLESLHYKLYVEAFDIELKKHITYKYAENLEQGKLWLHSKGFEGF
jgi:hypothetical protein